MAAASPPMTRTASSRWSTWGRAKFAASPCRSVHSPATSSSRRSRRTPIPSCSWAYDQTPNIEGGGTTEHAEVFGIFEGMISDNVLPPDLKAAIFRALKQVPGVTVKTVEVNGQRVYALGQTDAWLRQELLLDAETHDYVGQTGTVTRDTTISPEKAGNATGKVRAGQKAAAMRIITAIVDEPGQRP